MLRNLSAICFLLMLSACQKEISDAPNTTNSQNAGIAETEDRTDQPLPAAPVYEYYPGSCKLSLRISYSSAFSESQPVSARVRIRGGNVNGSSTFFDFETTIYNQNRWKELTLPQGAFLFITVLEVSAPFGSNDYLRIQTGEFGFNKGQTLQAEGNIFGGYFLNIEHRGLVDKFPPYNDVNDVSYVCAPWCTWTISYEVGGDPNTQDGPNVVFRYLSGGSNGIIKVFGLSPNTSGLKRIYPLSSPGQAPLVYQCEATTPPTTPPPFCYDIISQNNVVIPPQNVAPAPPRLFDLTYGFSPQLACDSYCKMTALSQEYPKCQ